MGYLKRIEDLYFGITYWKDGEPHVGNLFAAPRIRRSIALYRTGKYAKCCKEVAHFDDTPRRWAFWCFGDTCGRYEWEFGFGDPFQNRDGSWTGVKTDVFTVFVLPNIAMLRQMVDEVSISSCRHWLREHKR